MAARDSPSSTRPAPGLVYSTYLFGFQDGALQIAVDGSGNAYLTGSSPLADIPTTPDAYSPTPGDFQVPFYLAVFGKGNLLYATYFGGANTVNLGSFAGIAGSITIAPETGAGSVYLGGFSSADDFPSRRAPSSRPTPADPRTRGPSSSTSRRSDREAEAVPGGSRCCDGPPGRGCPAASAVLSKAARNAGCRERPLTVMSNYAAHE
jgi:hypothetical protein